jgi:AAA domain
MTTKPLARLAATDLERLDLPEREPLLDPIIDSKTIALLYGPRGLGKTFVALGIAWAAASGGSFLGWRARRPYQVVYVDGEMAAVDLRRRLALFGPAPPTLDFILADLGHEAMPDLAHYEGQARLMASWGWPDLVILDNLATLLGRRTGDPDRWHQFEQFLMLQRRHGRAVLMLHHANKKGVQRGTSRREDAVDLVMAMRRPAGYRARDGAHFEIHYEKARSLLGTPVQPVEAQLLSDGARARWQWKPAAEDPIDQAVRLLGQGLGVAAMAEALGVSPATGYRLRTRARNAGRL